MLKSFPYALQGLNLCYGQKKIWAPYSLREICYVQQFENFKIYKDLYRKLLNCDWTARVNLQILFTLAALAITSFEIMLFQVLQKLFKKKKQNKKLVLNYVYRKLITWLTIEKRLFILQKKFSLLLPSLLLKLLRQQHLPICNAFV